MPLHAVLHSIKLSDIIFIIMLSVPKYVYCLAYILFLAKITSYQINQTLLITVKTVVDFIRPLVVIKHRHVSFCYIY